MKRWLAAMPLFFLLAPPAQALVAPFDNLLPALLEGKKAPRAVRIRRTRQVFAAGEEGTAQLQEQTLLLTPGGKFTLETRAGAAVTTQIWDGKKGADLIEGLGFCPRANLALPLYERLLIAATEVDFKLAAVPLHIDYAAASVALGPDDRFVYAYGAERETEEKNQLLIDPERKQLVGLILAGSPRQRISFRNWQVRQGVSYPERIEIALGGRTAEVYEIREVAPAADTPALFDPMALAAKAPRRAECPLESPAPPAPDLPGVAADPDKELRDWDRRLGR